MDQSLQHAFDALKFGEDAFHELMRWRVRRILLVLPQYDAWILEHDAKLSDQIVGEYHQLNLTTVPRLTTVNDAASAREALASDSFDLMILGLRTGEESAFSLARDAKVLQDELAVLLLLPSRSDLAVLEGLSGDHRSGVDATFLWTGDSRLLLAMVKYVEDLRNAPSDAGRGPVGVLLVVEDSVPFYSTYLPLLYAEMMTQTQRLISEEMNDADKYYRMRTRPKILLARDWEEAVSLADRYGDSLIGVVSDMAFRRDGVLDDRAGFRLLDRFRDRGTAVPILFQSSDTTLAVEARSRGARFQAKGSSDLHRGIRRFVLEELGFGDFVFRRPDGSEFLRVRTLREFENAVPSLPAESLVYHGARDDYSTWLAAHGEYRVARKIKPICAADFPDAEAQREFLVRSFREIRLSRHRGRLVDFRLDDPETPGAVARIGSGSLGGKGRGLAFFNALLNAAPWGERFEPMTMEVPPTLIIATGEFDRFLETTGLPGQTEGDDGILQSRFLASPLHEDLKNSLRAFLGQHSGPLAVRSSGLLEDSQSLPFAGVYATYMISGISDDDRLNRLCDAIRLVWASVFSLEATVYRDSLALSREDEKMAVVIQKISGRPHGRWYFPRISGTAQSINYYPVGPMVREDGVARIALGLGRSVVEGGRGHLFCPDHPGVAWGTDEDKWREGQTDFWALDLESRHDLSQGESETLRRLEVRDAESLGVLRHLASTWDAHDHRIRDGIDTPGPRILDFRDILDYEWLPLAKLLGALLHAAQDALGTPVEMEYALDWSGDLPGDAVFSLLQVRPLTGFASPLEDRRKRPVDENLVLRSSRAMGHGDVENLRDILWIDPDLYEGEHTETYRDMVADAMDDLAEEGRSCILIGPGRWGSRDRFLGIPVSWAQVRQTRLIVEVARGPGDPEPSQGSHFFHNLVSLGAGYAYVPRSEDSSRRGFVDWTWLREFSSGNGVLRHAQLDHPMKLCMNGKNGEIWVEK